MCCIAFLCTRDRGQRDTARATGGGLIYMEVLPSCLELGVASHKMHML